MKSDTTNVNLGKLGYRNTSSSAIMLSIVTVNYNNAELLTEALNRTITTLDGLNFEIIIVDNNSEDDSYDFLTREFQSVDEVRVIHSGHNGGFGFGCNIGVREARGAVLWFLNSDAWVSEIEGLEDTLSFCQEENTGLIGTSVLLQNGVATPQGGGDMSFGFFLVSSFRLGKLLRTVNPTLYFAIVRQMSKGRGLLGRYSYSLLHSEATRRYASVGIGGASFLIDRSKYEELDGFDEQFFLYDEDGDLCLRCLKLGLVNYIEPKVKVMTIGSATTSKLPSLQLKRIKCHSRLRLVRKHFEGVQRLVLLLVTRLTWRLL